MAINGWNGRSRLVATDPGGAVWKWLVCRAGFLLGLALAGGTGIQDLALAALPRRQLGLFALGGDGHVLRRAPRARDGQPAGVESLVLPGGRGVRGISRRPPMQTRARATLLRIGGDKIVHEIRQQGPCGPSTGA